MKIKRHKHIKRVLKFYKYQHKLDVTKSGVQILIDGTFAKEALTCKLNLREQLPSMFDMKEKTSEGAQVAGKFVANCQLLTTKCAIHETEILGKATRGAMHILKQYKLVECQHKRAYVNSEKCFKNLLVAAKQTGTHYFVATQSPTLKGIVREQTGVPLIIISHNAINLEKPNETTAAVDKTTSKTTDVTNKNVKNDILAESSQSKVNAKKAGKLSEFDVIKKLKNQLLKEDSSMKQVFKRKKAKGPNPLSCKKKKTPNKTVKK